MIPRIFVWSLALFAALFSLSVMADKAQAAEPLQCLNARVVDGDSINCSNLGRIRLLGIDAPDRLSSSPCRGGYGDHVCNDEGARRAKLSLAMAIGGTVLVEPITHDRYGRTVAIATSGGINLSCWQISQGAARYIARYDNGRRLASACPASAKAR